MRKPRIYRGRALQKIFPASARPFLQSALAEASFEIGVEHARYVLSAMTQKRPLEKIFKDIGRFRFICTSETFFAKRPAGTAASTVLPLSDSAKDLFPSKVWGVRGFIGKKGDRSSLHFDWQMCPNLLFNFKGRKRVELYSPRQSHKLRGFGNFSFHRSKPNAVFEIGENEAVLIPALWWHQITYLTDAESVSIRFMPSSLHEFGMNELYPSWKAIQLFGSVSSRSEKKLALELKGFLHPEDTAEERFRKLESFYAKRIPLHTRNNRFYGPWCMAYLQKYLGLKSLSQ